MRVPLALALIGSAIIAACSSGPRWKGRDPVFSKLPVSRNPRYAKANLIEISQVDSSISIDLRYTRGSTILKSPLYEMGMPALLRPETAVRLRRANEVVKKHGYRIQIWDAYRPPSAQLKLWYASGEDVRSLEDDIVTLTWAGVEGANYQIEDSTDLLTWDSLDVTNSFENGQWSSSFPSLQTQRFLRITLP